MNQILYISIAVAAGLAAGIAFVLIFHAKLKDKRSAIEKEREKIIAEAQKEADRIRKEAHVEAKDVVYQAKAEVREGTKRKTL